jgi:hypothetical protein
MADAALAIVSPKQYRLRESRMQRVEFKNTFWDVVVEAGTPFEEILQPEFWAHVIRGKNLMAGDEIRVRPDEGHYLARLFVRDVGPLGNWAKVALLEKFDFDGEQTQSGDQDIDGFEIKFQGPVNKHVVVRKKDGAVIMQGISTRVEAAAWLSDYARTLSR